MYLQCERGVEYLVLVTLIALAGVVHGLGANLFVVLLEGGKVLTGLGELTRAAMLKRRILSMADAVTRQSLVGRPPLCGWLS